MPEPEPEPLRWDTPLPTGEVLRFDMGPDITWDGTVPARFQKPTNTIHMSQDLISAEITKTFADELIADIHALREKQKAFLLSLPAEVKEAIAKMGTGNMALEGVIRTAATENPGELAADFPLAEWDKDRGFGTNYRPVVSAMKKLASDMEDTLLAADSDSWTAAGDAYGDLKKDAVGPAIDQARGMYRERRRGSGPKTPKPRTPSTPPPA